MMSDFVPKLHPLDRGLEAEDPMELIPTPVEGDPEVMLECILQEYLWMGWGREQLLMLFHSPAYPLLNQLRDLYGDEEVARRVDDLLSRWGVLQFRETLYEDETAIDEDELQLVQLSVMTNDEIPNNEGSTNDEGRTASMTFDRQVRV